MQALPVDGTQSSAPEAGTVVDTVTNQVASTTVATTDSVTLTTQTGTAQGAPKGTEQSATGMQAQSQGVTVGRPSVGMYGQPQMMYFIPVMPMQNGAQAMPMAPNYVVPQGYVMPQGYAVPQGYRMVPMMMVPTNTQSAPVPATPVKPNESSPK